MKKQSSHFDKDEGKLVEKFILDTPGLEPVTFYTDGIR